MKVSKHDQFLSLTAAILTVPSLSLFTTLIIDWIQNQDQYITAFQAAHDERIVYDKRILEYKKKQVQDQLEAKKKVDDALKVAQSKK